MAASSSSSRLPLTVLLFLLLVLVVASAAVPATAAGEYSGARMVIIRGSGTSWVGGSSSSAAGGGAQSNKWRQHYRRLVEDEVAPELVGGLLGAGSIGYGPLNKDAPACPPSDKEPCAAKGPGDPYIRGCKYKDRCPH